MASPADHPLTDSGATLGRVLFYDKDLSIDGMIAPLPLKCRPPCPSRITRRWDSAAAMAIPNSTLC